MSDVFIVSKERRNILNVKTWQRELSDLGFILESMINRSGVFVTVADQVMGELIGIIVPPPESADFRI